MNREILFRGKKECDENWDCGFLSWADTNRGRNYFINNNIAITDTVGQFSGLTDKNGKKIFEGDIIVRRIFSWVAKFICKWDANNGCFKFVEINKKSSISVNDLAKCIKTFKTCVEIVGNIFDNKDLFKYLEQ